MIGFRQADPRFPFLWESGAQPPGRWHGAGEGPVHYIADTPNGAWAELLRHEEITEPADVATIRRALWAIDIGQAAAEAVRLSPATATGDPETYGRCQAHARRARARGVTRLSAPSAALLPGAAAGIVVAGGERPAPARDGRVIVIFGPPDGLVGWQVVADSSPPARLLPHVRHFSRTTAREALRHPPRQSPPRRRPPAR
jgi:hypothetical protein